MDYRTVRGIFFAEPEQVAPTPPAVTTGTPARRLRDAIEPLACQSIWSEEAADRYVELGLDDWFAAYIWERTAALGTPPTALAVMVVARLHWSRDRRLAWQAVAQRAGADIRVRSAPVMEDQRDERVS